MADEDELKSMIFSFRVSELHMLLSFAGRNKSGRKTELQARAIELLDLGSYPVILKIRNLYKAIQQGLPPVPIAAGTEPSVAQLGETTKPAAPISNSTNGTTMQPGRGYPPPNYTIQPNTLSSQQRSVYNSANLYHNYQKMPTQLPEIPVHPDVKFKTLPFYEFVAELMKPSSLVPQGSQRNQESTFVFHLTPQQSTMVGSSRDMRPVTKAEYTTQVQVRFCLLETTSEQEDCFPPGIIVKVNGKMCQLPNPIPTNKPGVEPKRPPRPVNITPQIKISPTVANTVHVQWSTDYTRGYVVGVYLVNKKTSEDLLNRLKARGIRGADYTRGMIKDKLNEDADSEIATTSLRVSLVCPLGKMRMCTPCRASTCQHLQCFDASLYLQMNERKPTWMCPVCDRPAVYDRLVIDGYFCDVLVSPKLPHDGSEIQLHADGTWSSLVVKKEQSRVVDPVESVQPVKPEPKVEMLDLDVEETDSKPTEPAQKKKEVVVDLTLSDSDDEPLMPPKKKLNVDSNCSDARQVPKYAETSNTVTSTEQHSPSLIILDGDSPPVTPQPRGPPPTYATAAAYLAPQTHFLDLDADPSSYNRF